MNHVLFLKINAAGQLAMAFLLLMQETPLNTSIGAVTAFGTFANLVVLIGLIYKIGRYTGTTDQTIIGMRESINSLKVSDDKIMATQELHGTALTKLESNSSNMQADIRIVRDRQHEFASLLTRLTMQPIDLKKMERQRPSFGPADQG